MLLAVVAFAPVALGARALRRRFLPELTGPTVALAVVVLALGIVVGVGELLGSVGGFRLVPMTVALALVGFAAVRFAPATAVTSGPPGARESTAESGAEAVAEDAIVVPRSERVRRLWRAVAIISVAVLFAEWMNRVVDSWRRGMTTADTLWYHLPMAARFAQDGWTSRLHFVDSASLIVFYPATSELLHATGMVFLGNDFLSLVLNLGWLALALFVAWCIGSRFGVAPLTLVGAAVVLATPELVIDDAGSGLNDVVGIALFLAAVALVANAMRPEASPRARRAEMLCGALAAGLAVGTKYTMVGPAAALAIGVFALTPRGRAAPHDDPLARSGDRRRRLLVPAQPADGRQPRTDDASRARTGPPAEHPVRGNVIGCALRLARRGVAVVFPARAARRVRSGVVRPGRGDGRGVRPERAAPGRAVGARADVRRGRQPGLLCRDAADPRRPVPRVLHRQQRGTPRPRSSSAVWSCRSC